MPLYEYRCDKCGKVFEVRQKFSDSPLKIHEECGGAVERLLSAPAFQFKGSGWYITDYAKNSSPKSDGKSGDASGSKSSDSKSSDSKSSETKPETKTESKPATTATTKSD